MRVEIRHFTWADVEPIARLHRAAELIDRAGRTGDAIALSHHWCRPGSAPEEECLVAEAEGKLIGYALRSAAGSDGQCLVDCVVHPAWRQRGVGRELVSCMASDAGRAGAQSLGLRARDDEPATVAFCRALGFQAVRVWHRMWLEPLRVPPFMFPTGYGWRYFRPHCDEAAYAAIVNATFDEHWGTGPTTPERIAYRAGQAGFEPTNIVFAMQREEVIGVCVARFIERTLGWRRLSAAHIGPVGVSAVHRRCGLAHAMLSACLQQCRRRQIEAAELDVDEGNVAAIHVYEDCGFESLFRIIWYCRDLGVDGLA